MTILMALTNIAFPAGVLLMLIAVAALVIPDKCNSEAIDSVCEHVFMVSAVLIVAIVVFDITVGLITSITNFCALV